MPSGWCGQPVGWPAVAVARPAAAVCGRVYSHSHTPLVCNVRARVKPSRGGSAEGAWDQEATHSRVTVARRWRTTESGAKVPPSVPTAPGRNVRERFHKLG
jgi:hypothetical protein